MPSQVFTEDQLPHLTRSASKVGKNTPSLFDDLVERGQWKFLPNTERTEASVRHDSRPQPPCRLLKQGRKYSTMKRYFDSENLEVVRVSKDGSGLGRRFKQVYSETKGWAEGDLTKINPYK